MTRVVRSVLAATQMIRRMSTYWVRGNNNVAVCATVESTRLDDSNEMAKKAEELVRQIASPVMRGVAFKGVVLGGDGRGRLRATGIAEVPWNPGLESELKRMGIVEVK